MSKNNSINQRFNELVEVLFEGNNSKTAQELNTNEANIRNYRTKTVPKIEIIRLLHQKFEISYEWIIEGTGSIPKELNKGEQLFFEEHESTQTPKVQSFDLVTDSKLEHQRIPLYSIQATAGVVPLFANSDRFEPVDHITIPNLPKSDGALFVSGDSMYPLLKSGDIVIYKTISGCIEDIYFGEMYIVSLELAGEEYTSVKFIQRSELGEAYIKLVSQNKHHEDKDVRVSKIRAMALVKASIRINSM